MSISLLFLPILGNASDTKFYAGLGIGSANIEGPELESGLLLPNQKVEDSSNLTSIYIGYSINKNISFELGFSDFEKIKDKVQKDPNVSNFVAINEYYSIKSEKIFFQY